MSILKEGTIITIDNKTYIVNKGDNVYSCNSCAFVNTNMCAGGLGKRLKIPVACAELLGETGNLKEIKLKGGV